MKYFSPQELATLLQQSRENIRLWSIEFAPHLSQSAAPREKGKHRSYTDTDVSVLALVADYTNRNISFSEIHKALDDNERMMPAVALVNGVDPDKALALQARITDLETRIAVRDGQVDLLKEQLRDANAEIARLNRLLGQG